MIYLFTTIFFILLQGFFSGMETGLISLLKPRVKHGVENGEKSAKILMFFINNPSLLLATTLLGTNICVVCSSNMAKKTVVSFGFDGEFAFFLTGLFMSLILLNAEIIPKDWFRQFPYPRTRRFAVIFYLTYCIFYIPAHILSWYTMWINRLAMKKNIAQDNKSIIRKDFLLLLRESEKSGLLDKSIARIIDSSLYIQNLKAINFMIKRENIVEIDENKTLKDAYLLSQKTRLSRILVKKTQDKSENWIGFISIYDIIFDIDEKDWEKMKVLDILRPLKEIKSEEKVINLIQNPLKISSPLVAVKESRTNSHIGVIDIFDICQKLFGF
ncbi:MAG TPA: CNNM domain-containing protein [Victivallales bacterium]|nr:CNNM domain-containing protein [Victivallales bacterium]